MSCVFFFYYYYLVLLLREVIETLFPVHLAYGNKDTPNSMNCWWAFLFSFWSTKLFLLPKEKSLYSQFNNKSNEAIQLILTVKSQNFSYLTPPFPIKHYEGSNQHTKPTTYNQIPAASKLSVLHSELNCSCHWHKCQV